MKQASLDWKQFTDSPGLRGRESILQMNEAKITEEIIGFTANGERTANHFDKRLGERVRARRFELGMSQEQLSHMLGITFQQVQKYEKGTNRIAASRLFDMAAALDMPVAQFFEGLSGGQAAKSTKTASLDAALAIPGVVDLVQQFAAIDDSTVRKRILDLVRAITANP